MKKHIKDSLEQIYICPDCGFSTIGNDIKVCPDCDVKLVPEEDLDDGDDKEKDSFGFHDSDM